MKISYKWLGEWVDLSQFKSPTEVADLLTSRGLEVEEVKGQDQGLEKVVAVQIITKDKHPEADRLSICKVSTGSGDYLEIVCGAQNMKAGDIVALAQIGANLPNGMKIEKGKIRGVVSNGMLCSEVELGLAKDSDGILILPPKTPLGWKMADVLGLDDTILEVKLTANRGDCLSHRGMAREIAAAIGKPLKSPKLPVLPLSENSGIAFTPAVAKAISDHPAIRSFDIKLSAGEDAPQFFGCFINGVKVMDSPAWLKTRLESIGQRSINNLVDASNFLMFEYGLPVHIYDADKLEGNVIEVRRSVKGEKLLLLDGAEIETTGEELVIADSVKPVGLAGVMGGGNSEVSANTKRVYLECAEFNPTLVRKAAFRFNRRSEASLRFEKGIDPSGHAEALARLADLVIRVSGGEVINAGKKQLPSRENFKARAVKVSSTYMNDFLGTSVPESQMLEIFKQLDCEVLKQGNDLVITPPSFRLDLNIPQDFAEEIARTVGYDTIPTTIPVLTGMPHPKKDNALAHRLGTINRVKDILAEQGLSEVLTYAFQSESWIQKFGFSSSVKIMNPLSEEQGFLVPSLLPGMMKAYQENERHHFGSEPLAVRLFEVRPVFEAKLPEGKTVIEAIDENTTGVTETWKVSVLLTGPRYDQSIKSERGEIDFFDLKACVENIFDALRTKGIRMRAADSQILGSQSNLYHSGQVIQLAAGKEPIGFFGRIHPKLETELKLRAPVYWAEFNLEPVISLTPMTDVAFKPWSTFPTMERDFALLVDDTVPAENLINAAIKNGKPIAKVVKIFDTYKGTHIPEGKISIGVRVIFSNEAKSLEEKQVDESSEIIVKKWIEEFGATLR
jgi:phenylalanyl-tRNA synthetase beta chain